MYLIYLAVHTSTFPDVIRSWRNVTCMSWWGGWFNSLPPRRYGCNFRCNITWFFKLIFVIELHLTSAFPVKFGLGWTYRTSLNAVTVVVQVMLWCCQAILTVAKTYKNIERHTAHTIVSWPSPKQWIIVHTSDLMMIIRQLKVYTFSVIIREMGKLKTHSPI